MQSFETSLLNQVVETTAPLSPDDTVGGRTGTVVAITCSPHGYGLTIMLADSRDGTIFTVHSDALVRIVTPPKKEKAKVE